MLARQQLVQAAEIISIKEDEHWVHFKPFVKNAEGDEAVHPYPDLTQENSVYAPHKLHINLSLDAILYPQIVLIGYNLKKYLKGKIEEGVIPTFKHLNGLQHRKKNVDGIETVFNDWKDNEILSSSLISNPGSDFSNQRCVHFAQFTISLFNDTSAEYCNAIQSLIIDINRIIALCGYPIENNPRLCQSCDSHLYGHVSFRKDYFLLGEGGYEYVPTSDYYNDRAQTVLNENESCVRRLAEQNGDPFLGNLRDFNWPALAECNLKEIKENETFLQSKFQSSFEPIAQYTPLQLELIRELDDFKKNQHGFLLPQDEKIFQSLRQYLTRQAKKEDEQKGKDDEQYPIPGKKLQEIILNEKFSSIVPPGMLKKMREYKQMLALRDELVGELNAYIRARAIKSTSDKFFGHLKTMTQDVKTRAAQSLRSHLSNFDERIPKYVCFTKEEVEALTEGDLGKMITQNKYQTLLPGDIKSAHENKKPGILQKLGIQSQNKG